MQSLQIGKPPDNVKISDLFATITKRVSAVLPPLFTAKMTAEDWTVLAALCADLTAEFKTRREMLLTRLDLTRQSFGVS